MFTSTEKMTAQKLNELFGLVRVAVGEVTGTYPDIKTDWQNNDIVDVENWNKMVSVIKKYGEPYIQPAITYASTWQNLNNIETAASRMRAMHGSMKKQIPFKLQEGSEDIC